MKLLIIGGTRFLGRALVDEARLMGHTVTLFNRGQSNPNLYPDVEQIRGDRDGGLDALSGRRWDAVIDTCGYLPRIVRAARIALWWFASGAWQSEQVFVPVLRTVCGKGGAKAWAL